VSKSGALYFGEYFMNPDRRAVRIIRIPAGGKELAIAYQFPPGLIRHVHGVHRDRFQPERIWVSVGDRNGECYLYWTDDEFCNLSQVGDGSQVWRAVGLMFTQDKLVWGTDSPHQQNHFVSLDRHSGKLEIGQAVRGTVWYSGVTSDGVYFAGTSVEKGPGVTTNQACVLISSDASRWKTCARFTKDWLPMPLFKWGTISFPTGCYSSKVLWISGEALSGLDGKSLLLKI